MNAADTLQTRQHQTSKHRSMGLGLSLVLFLASGCVVETTTTRTTAVGSGASSEPTIAVPTVGRVEFEPTPTPEPVATPVPAATSVPTPAPAPTPAATPIPPLVPAEDVEPSDVASGTVTVPVGGTTQFILSDPRPILQLPGHTLIYIDADRRAEVDIFTPAATGTGALLDGYDAVIAQLINDPIYANVDERDSISIAGLPTRVFEGQPVMGERGFYTDLTTRDNDAAGWFPPLQVRMWVIDAPTGPVVVSAETLEQPGQYSDAIRLATEILTTITFS